jgi:hypothetical protein
VPIVVKLDSQHVDGAEERLRERVSGVLPDRARSRVHVEKLFPAHQQGNRARLFSVELPPDLTPREVQAVVDAVGADEGVEYASVPAAKRPI